MSAHGTSRRFAVTYRLGRYWRHSGYEWGVASAKNVEICKFDPESLVTLKRSFVDLKLLPTPPDMSALYTEAFLPK